MIKRIVFIPFILALAVVSARADQIDPRLEAAIREKASEVLFDAESARFTFDIVRQINEVGGKICGTVNAKNAFGAYTGKKFFLAGYMRVGTGYRVLLFSPSDYSLEVALTNSKTCD